MKCGAVLSLQSEADGNVICSVMIGLVLWSWCCWWLWNSEICIEVYWCMSPEVTQWMINDVFLGTMSDRLKCHNRNIVCYTLSHRCCLSKYQRSICLQICFPVQFVLDTYFLIAFEDYLILYFDLFFLIEKHSLSFIETSALDCTNVESAFHTILTGIGIKTVLILRPRLVLKCLKAA